LRVLSPWNLAMATSALDPAHLIDNEPRAESMTTQMVRSGLEPQPGDSDGDELRRQESLQQENDGVASPEASRQAVRDSLQVAMEASFSRCGHIWIYSSFALVLGLLGLISWGWFVYQNHSEDKCDEPLASMLRVFYIIICIYGLKKELMRCCCCFDPASTGGVEPPRVKIFMRCLILATLLWPVVATYMLSQSQDCSSYLKRIVVYITVYYVVVAVVVVALPAVTISVMLVLVRRGIIREPRSGAPENFIDTVPTIAYEPSLFNDDGGRHPLSCPICMEDFDAQTPISKTSCGENGHVFHRGCLDGWLQFSRTCPLCRTDLTEDAV